MDIKVIEAIGRMKELTEITSLALLELNDQDTGWYYHLKSANENARRALRDLNDT